MTLTSLLQSTTLPLEAILPHAFSVNFIVIVGKTEIGVEHHHFVKSIRFVLRDDVPLVLLGANLHSSPAVHQHRAIVIIVEGSGGVRLHPRTIVA